MDDHSKLSERDDASYNELLHIDWEGISHFPLVMKYIFTDDGYTLMISNLTHVYGEKLDESGIQKRFKLLNPYAEMLPRVTLRHLKQFVKNLSTCENSDFNFTYGSEKLTFSHEFNIIGGCFLFRFELQMLPRKQFEMHVVKPTILRALTLDEENASLQRRIEELEGRENSASSNRSEEVRKVNTALLEMDKHEYLKPTGLAVAFLHLQKHKMFSPRKIEDSANNFVDKSPSKRVKSKGSLATEEPNDGSPVAMTSYSTVKRMMNSRNSFEAIRYVDDDSFAGRNKTRQGSNTNEPDTSSNGFSTEAQDVNQPSSVHAHIPPRKREAGEENCNEKGASKPEFRPKSESKRKHMKF